ncbi:MAG: cytochrome c3 family protein [Coriobacteriales bacterium]|jgi:hypothetical protein|nr:cytochrome c3 family protein [Coriobacteriales bacterium]
MTTTKKKVTKRSWIRLIILGVVCALVSALALTVGCAPSGPNPQTENVAEQDSSMAGTEPVNWTMQSECATCHISEAESMTDMECPQAYAHQNEASCVDCHTDEPLLATVHADLTYADASHPASKPTVESVPEQSCVSCHGTLDDMALITAESTALKDDQGTIVNPHARPAGQTHAQNPATCTDCHNNHSKNLSKDAMKYCASCHHRGVFACGTCHEVRTRT